MLPSLFRCLTLLPFVYLLASVTPSRAEQYVLFDVTFPYTKTDADHSKPNESHYYVKSDRLNPARPKDWTAPVDYRNGTVHVRLEVIEKPAGSEPTMWSVCYIPYKGQNKGYGCISTPTYRETGVFENDIPMTKFWQHDHIVWSEGIRQMDLVIKDGKGVKGHLQPHPEKFFPTKIRLTLIQVSAGAKYDPKLVPELSQAAEKK